MSGLCGTGKWYKEKSDESVKGPQVFPYEKFFAPLPLVNALNSTKNVRQNAGHAELNSRAAAVLHRP